MGSKAGPAGGRKVLANGGWVCDAVCAEARSKRPRRNNGCCDGDRGNPGCLSRENTPNKWLKAAKIA